MALAILLQFSIDPAVAPFVPRWAGDSARIDFGIERSAGRDFVAKTYVAYDPHDLDARHAELYRPHTEIIDMRLPNYSQPASTFMVNTGALQQAVLDLCSGCLDVPTLRAQARQAPACLPDPVRQPRHALLACAAPRAAIRQGECLVARGSVPVGTICLHFDPQ